MEINIAKPDSKQFSDSPQPIVRNLNIQTKVFNKDSPLRVSTDTSFQTHSNFSSPSDPNYLTKPVDSASGNSKSPRLDTAVVPTPIFKDLDKDLAKFRRRTNTCIVANNGKEYHGHWTAHYCTGSEEIEGILTIDDNSLVFAATLDLQGEVKTSTFASRLLPFLAKPKETFTKIFGEFEVVINMQDIAECHIMDFPVPCSKHSNKTQKVYLLQLCLTNHGDYSIEKNIDGILLDMKNKKTPYVSLFFNLRSEGDIQEPETNKPSETLLKIQSRIENTINSLQAGQGNGIATDVPYFEFLIEKFDTTQRPLLRTAKQVVNENLKLRLKSHKENHKSPKEKLKAPKLSPTSNKEGVKSNPQLLKPKRIVSPIVLDQSSIVSSDQFAQIVSCAPDLYQMFEWKLEYSNSLHGTSYNNLMRRAKFAKPFVIIIRDTSNNVFGAYGSEVLKSSLSYYGTGETFLFTFRKTNDITEYRWSKKNDLFIFANEDGIMFGAGPFYGLWIENELTRGRTYACDTFDNQPLSESTDFQIARIELWSVVDPFSKK